MEAVHAGSAVGSAALEGAAGFHPACNAYTLVSGKTAGGRKANLWERVGAGVGLVPIGAMLNSARLPKGLKISLEALDSGQWSGKARNPRKIHSWAEVPKPRLSELPLLGMKTNTFGHKFIQWGRTGEEAIKRARSLTEADISFFKSQGMTAEIADQWSNAYWQLHKYTVGRLGQVDELANPLGRALLMREIARRLRL